MGQTWAVEKTLLQPGGKLGFCWADLWWCFWCRVSLPAIWRIWSSSPNLQEFNGWLWPLSKWLHQMSITPQVIHVFSTLVWVKYKLLVHEFQKVQPDCIPVPPTGSHTWFLFILHVPFTSGYEHWIQKWGSYKQSNQHGNIETRYTPKIFNMKAKNHHIWNWTSSSKPAFFLGSMLYFPGCMPPNIGVIQLLLRLLCLLDLWWTVTPTSVHGSCAGRHTSRCWQCCVGSWCLQRMRWL